MTFVSQNREGKRRRACNLFIASHLNIFLPHLSHVTPSVVDQGEITKGIGHYKTNMLSLFTHSHVIPNLCGFLSSVEHKRRCFWVTLCMQLQDMETHKHHNHIHSPLLKLYDNVSVNNSFSHRKVQYHWLQKKVVYWSYGLLLWCFLNLKAPKN